MTGCTVLRAVKGKRLTKAYQLNRAGRVVKRTYDSAGEFLSEQREIDGVAGLHALLAELQHRHDCAIIHARPGRWHPGPGMAVVRRIYAAPELADHRGNFHKFARTGDDRTRQDGDIAESRLAAVTRLPMFEVVPTDLLLLDFDKLAMPAGVEWRDDLAYTARFLRLQLPFEFHAAACVYYATSSAADLSKPDLGGHEIRMRLGFVLDRPLTATEGKAWLSPVAGLDLATLNPVQLVYTASPVFSPGLEDPLAGRRLGMLEGAPLVPVPAIQVARQPPREAFATLGPTLSAEGLGLLRSARLEVALERLTGEAGKVRSGLQRAAAAYIRDVGRDRVDIAALVTMLTKAGERHRSPGEVAGYGLERLVAWTLERAPETMIAPPHYPEEGLTPDEAMARLRNLLAEAVADAACWISTCEGKPPRVGFKAGAGLGKTSTALALIAAIPGIEYLCVELYVPTHRLAEELATKVRPGLRVLHIEGRNKRTCANHEVAEALGEAGLNVSMHACEDGACECEWRDGCPYHDQFDEWPAIRIFTHSNLFVQRNDKLPPPDLAVIDERWWPAGLVHKTMPLDRLVSRSRWKQGKVTGDERINAEYLSTKVRNAFEAGINPLAVVTRADCLYMARIEGNCFTEPNVTPAMEPAHQLKNLRAWQSRENGNANRAWKLLAEAFDYPDRMPQRIRVQRDDKTDDGPRHRLHLHFRRDLTVPEAPMILLDADMDPLITEKLLPGTKSHEIAVQQNAYVVQVVDRYCGTMSSLLGKEDDEHSQLKAQERRDQLEAFLLQMPPGGLFVTYKAVLALLELPEELATVHLGNLRGLDEFKGCRWVAIAGRLQPDPWALELMLRSLFGDDPEPLKLLEPDGRGLINYTTERRGYRVAKGAPPYDVEVQVHPDSRGQALLEQVREREIEQAVARLRLVHRPEPALVFLITNTVVNLTIAATTNWPALLHNREAILKARLGGIVLHSPAERARAARDLWPTAEAAKEDARRGKMEGLGTPLSKILSFSGLCPNPAFIEVEYRREGESELGGRNYRASVPGGLTHEAAADLLAARLGPGVIVKPPEPNRKKRGRPAKGRCAACGRGAGRPSQPVNIGAGPPPMSSSFPLSPPETAEAYEVRIGARCHVCHRRIGWPRADGIVFADGTAECRDCLDREAA